MKKKIVIICWLLSIIFTVLLCLWYENMKPYYSIDISYLVKNETDKSLKVIFYFIDIMENDKHMFRSESYEMRPATEHFFVHPEYDLTQQRLVFIQLLNNDKIIGTYSVKQHYRSDIFVIHPDPISIEQVTYKLHSHGGFLK